MSDINIALNFVYKNNNWLPDYKDFDLSKFFYICLDLKIVTICSPNSDLSLRLKAKCAK